MRGDAQSHLFWSFCTQVQSWRSDDGRIAKGQSEIFEDPFRTASRAQNAQPARMLGKRYTEAVQVALTMVIHDQPKTSVGHIEASIVGLLNPMC